jgi:hypothetical protein
MGVLGGRLSKLPLGNVHVQQLGSRLGRAHGQVAFQVHSCWCDNPRYKVSLSR